MWTSIALIIAGVIAFADIYFTMKDTKEYKELKKAQESVTQIKRVVTEDTIRRLSKERLEELDKKDKRIRDYYPELIEKFHNKSEEKMLTGITIKLFYKDLEYYCFDCSSSIDIETEFEDNVIDLLYLHIKKLKEQYDYLASGGVEDEINVGSKEEMINELSELRKCVKKMCERT